MFAVLLFSKRKTCHGRVHVSAIPLLQISRSYLETCTMARIHVEHVHDAHMTEKGQMINLHSQTGSNGDIHPFRNLLVLVYCYIIYLPV